MVQVQQKLLQKILLGALPVGSTVRIVYLKVRGTGLYTSVS